MDTLSPELKEELIEKQAILAEARKTLKQEFIGINSVVDEIVDNVSSWYFLPELHEKPVIINLWGLTGVGKTSLVERLVQLLHYRDSYFRFDLGKKKGNLSFRETLTELCESKDYKPTIIALDEIQQSRTVDARRFSYREDDNRLIWELLDSGKISYLSWRSNVWRVEDILTKLKNLVREGVRAKNGVITSKQELYENEFNCKVEKNGQIAFLSDEFYGRIIDIAGDRLGLKLNKDVKKLLMSKTEIETILFLEKVIRIGKSPKTKDFSKALIFVLGNLDEAYTMSHDLNTDIDADEFHNQSLKVTVPKIKSILQNYFREEQIARLGNIHIVYPALSNNDYQKIISNLLDTDAKRLTKTIGLKVVFDNSINQTIYSEGVYPAHGVRPIITSIHQILKSKLSFFLSQIAINNMQVDSIFFYVKDDLMFCDYLNNNVKLNTCSKAITKKLSQLRRVAKDDKQAIAAVHESGHAVLAITLLKIIPEVMCSKTTTDSTSGFVITKIPWAYISRKEIVSRVAMFLGGYVAETLVFGKNHLTAGATNDIDKATDFLTKMYKQCGMGQTPIRTGLPILQEQNTYHRNEAIEETIKSTIEKAKLLAEETLKTEKKLLLSLADYLSDNRNLKEEIKQFATKHLSQPIDFIVSGENLYYRKALKDKVKQLEDVELKTYNPDSYISVNRD